MLKLAAINSNNVKLTQLARELSPDEWVSKKIGNKKLSKHLLSIGLDNKEVSDLLSATVTDITTRIVSDEDTCRNQGNSIYYSSCQATDDRAKHSANSSINEIDGDMLHLDKSLFFWVAGNSMSVDGKGFTARAKLRIMYSDPNHTKIFGLWLEKIYGNALILMSNFNDLLDWWKNDMQQCTPIYKHSSEKSDTLVFIPSATDGYQDTASSSTYNYQVVMNESLLTKAYKLRSCNKFKSSKTYEYSLASIKFNPQNCEFIVPKIEDKSYRGQIDSNTRKHINMLIELFGFPKSSKFDKNNYRTYITFKYENDIEIIGYISSSIFTIIYNGKYILDVGRNKTRVVHDYGEFVQSVRLPYNYHEDERCLYVHETIGSWIKSLNIPYYYEKNDVLIVHSNHSDFYEAWDIHYYSQLSEETLDEINRDFNERYESTNRTD